MALRKKVSEQWKVIKANLRKFRPDRNPMRNLRWVTARSKAYWVAIDLSKKGP